MRLVICDDHHLLLEALATALSGQGFLVEAAVESPAEAVRAVELYNPDVLLIDLTFPEGSGLDAAREVVARHPHTKVVMMTAAEDPEPLMEALSLGVAGYLAKDQTVDAIGRSLELALRGGSVVDNRLLRRARRPAAPLPRQRGPLDVLTPRELDILRLLADGLSTRQIMRVLAVSESTVRTHVQNIFFKLGVHSRLQAVAMMAGEAPPVGDRHAALG